MHHVMSLSCIHSSPCFFNMQYEVHNIPPGWTAADLKQHLGAAHASISSEPSHANGSSSSSSNGAYAHHQQQAPGQEVMAVVQFACPEHLVVAHSRLCIPVTTHFGIPTTITMQVSRKCVHAIVCLAAII